MLSTQATGEESMALTVLAQQSSSVVLANCLTSLGRSFFTHKLEITIMSTSEAETIRVELRALLSRALSECKGAMCAFLNG